LKIAEEDFFLVKICANSHKIASSSLLQNKIRFSRSSDAHKLEEWLQSQFCRNSQIIAEEDFSQV
jgi:hypothetical protein